MVLGGGSHLGNLALNESGADVKSNKRLKYQEDPSWYEAQSRSGVYEGGLVEIQVVRKWRRKPPKHGERSMVKAHCDRVVV